MLIWEVNDSVATYACAFPTSDTGRCPEKRCTWRGKEDRRATVYPLDRLLLPTSPCWMSLISSGAPEEGDGNTDTFLDLLLLLLTKQIASAFPIFGNFKSVQNICERRCMKEHCKLLSAPGTMVTRCTKHTSCSHLGSSQHYTLQKAAEKSMLYFVL